MTAWLFLIGGAWAHNPHDPVHAVDISPTFGTDGIIVAAGIPAETYRQTDIIRTTDGGITFATPPRGLDNLDDLLEVRISPDFATDRTVVATAENGLYVSVDAGVTWSLHFAGTALGPAEMFPDASGPPVIAVAGAAGQVWCSRDVGETFVDCSPPGSTVILGLAAANDGSRVAAIGLDGVWLSSDRAETWTAAASLSPGTPQSVAVAPGLLLVGTDGGLVRSDDDGASFKAVNLPSGAVVAVGINPDFPTDGLVLAATDTAAAWSSDDGGTTWELHDAQVHLSTQSDRHFFQFRFARDFATSGCAVMGAFEGLFHTCDRGVTWQESDTRPPGMITNIGVSPYFADDGSLLVSTYMGGLYASYDRGETFANLNQHIGEGAVYDAQLLPDETGGLLQVAAQENWFLQAPPGEMWDRSELTLGNDIFPTEMAPDPAFVSSGVVLMGTRHKGIVRSADAGKTFDIVTGDGQVVSSILLDAAGHAWSGTLGGKLWKSVDTGVTWTEQSSLLPAESTGRIYIREEPGGRLWCGTVVGLYVSDDDGATFSLADGPPELTSDPIDQVAVADDGTVFAVVRGVGLYRGSAAVAFAPIAPQLEDASLQFNELEFSPTFSSDGTVFGADGVALLRSDDRGDTWTRIDPRPIRYDQLAQAVLTEGWEPDLSTSQSDLDSVNSSLEMSGEAAAISLTFLGDHVDIIGRTAPGNGEVSLLLDGEPIGTVNGDGPYANDIALWSSDTLPLAQHELRLEWLDRGPFDLDAFDVYSPVPTDGEGTAPEPADTGTGTPAPQGNIDGTGGCGCAYGGLTPGPALAAGLLALVRRRRRPAVQYGR